MWNALSIIAATEVGTSVKRNIMALAIYVIAGVVSLFAIFFALFGYYQWLLEMMNSIEASLSVSATLLVLALLVVCIGYVVKNRKQKTFPLASTALIVAPVAARMISRYPKTSLTSLLAVASAAMLLGRIATKTKDKNDE